MCIVCGLTKSQTRLSDFHNNTRDDVRPPRGRSWVWGLYQLCVLDGWSPIPHLTLQYTLVRDVVSSLRRHRMHEQQFAHPPLLVLNSFGPHGMHVKLMATMFQNLFPSINVHKVSQPVCDEGECR